MSSCPVWKVSIFLIILKFSLAQDQSPALFLTPYIESSQIIEAKRLAQVHNLSSTVVSYSGFITVDRDNGANIFFWFFPAAENPETAPVILWSEGGPGVSGLFSIFAEHGPFSVGPDGNLNLKETTWTRNHSIIYIDQPMDVGYSFTDSEAGYVTSGAAVAPNIYNFLVQFFKLFPELQQNPFYNAGASFGGIYAPAIAHYIHERNQENPEIRINLQGLILETPFTDPMSQVDYGEYLYPVGLIDQHALAHFRQQSALIKSLISQEKYLEAQELNLELLWGWPHGTYFTNVTGFTSNFNIVKDNLDESFTYIFIGEPKFRKSLHVGNLNFTFASPLVQTLFKPNILRSAKPLVEDLLNWGYKTLIYAGNLDIITNHIGVSTMVKSFQWDGSEEFANATRKIWRVDGNVVAGYAKMAKNLTYVMVRNAGHGATQDQPKWTFELLNRFTQGIDF